MNRRDFLVSATAASFALAVPTSGLSRKLVQERNDSNLPEIFPWAINTIQSGFENGITSEPEEISYDKYSVDGYKMGSAQFNVSYTDSMSRVLVLSNIIYNKGFVFAYAAPLAQFDQELPMIEEIIESVKFKD